ncbi:hypothetical protein Tco_0158721 [Tanacetum coccineum]
MANLSEDIQCASSDTRPPMLDKTDFASWQQRIRLYCRGKENGVNILKSIDEGPFQMGTTRVIVAEGTEGSLNLGPERPRVYSDLSQDEKDRYNADIRATNIILQGLPKDIYSLINHYTDAKDIWDNVKMLLEGSELTKEDRESQLVDRTEDRVIMHRVQVQLVMGEHRTEWGMLIQSWMKSKFIVPIWRTGTMAIDKCDEQPFNDLLSMWNICVLTNLDDSDAKIMMLMRPPTAQTCHAKLSSVDPVYDEAGPSYDSNVLSEVHDHDHYQDAVCDHHEEHENALRCTNQTTLLTSHPIIRVIGILHLMISM